MFLANIFRKYKEKEYRLLLLKDLIENLNIDNNQKKLYIDSLDILDDEALERFYNKLTSTMEILEDNLYESNKNKQKQEIFNLNIEEISEKTKEINSFNLILDNI